MELTWIAIAASLFMECPFQSPLVRSPSICQTSGVGISLDDPLVETPISNLFSRYRR
jgi:hypothetical protein